MPTLEEQIKAAKSNAAYYKNLGCGANEDIFACQYRKQQSSSSSSVPSAGTFSRPIEYGYVTRGVGGGHIGYDLGSSNKTIPIYPVADGQLYFAGYDNAGALIVIIRHNTGSGYLYSTYAHMSSFSGAVSGYVKSRRGTSESITNGPIISRNTTIGNMGSTGNSTGPHLHIEMATCSWHSQGGCLGYNAYLNRIVNPNRYITFPSQTDKTALLFFSCLIKNNTILYIAVGDNMEFKDLRKLNNLEKIYMIKEYIGVYLALMLKNDKERQKRQLAKTRICSYFEGGKNKHGSESDCAGCG